MATIILTGGGTAGHCTPHLAVLPYLKKDFDKIIYIGSESGIEKQIISQTELPYYSIPCAKLKRSLSAKNLVMPYKVVSGIVKAGKILDKVKPDVVFSKGGYVSLPTVIAAHQRKIPVVAHESDYTIGLANKLSAKFCKKILTSFPETAKQIKNGECVGSPIRNDLFSVKKNDALPLFGFNGNKPILLITGGSQGAQTINEIIRDALPDLIAKYDVIHICGRNNVNKNLVQKGYFQTEYMNKIENAFACADVCVSRAGSNTLFELMSQKIPCVLIPLPKTVSRGDQILNANYFQKLGLATVLPQECLTKDSLVYYINATYSNRFNVKNNFEKYPIKDSSRVISRILANLVN